jgi:glycosyltransferase involved in cell wall biosynthesis
MPIEFLSIKIFNIVKALFISRATLFLLKDKGGDTIQVINTAKYLKALGADVDILLCNDEIDYSSYDPIHFFQYYPTSRYIISHKKSDKPFVVSTIYVDYDEYEKKVRQGLASLVSKIFPSDLVEYFKVISRWLIKRERIISPSYLFLGQKRSIQKIMKGSAVLLPNSDSEYKRLSNQYKLNCKYKVIPNGIDPCLFQKNTDSIQKDPHLVICVGTVEGRKNQLNLIKALNDTE